MVLVLQTVVSSHQTLQARTGENVAIVMDFSLNITVPSVPYTHSQWYLVVRYAPDMLQNYHSAVNELHRNIHAGQMFHLFEMSSAIPGLVSCRGPPELKTIAHDLQRR